MSDHFYPADNRKGLRKLRDLRPNLFKAFLEFDAKVFEEGALSVKTKELIAVHRTHHSVSVLHRYAHQARQSRWCY